MRVPPKVTGTVSGAVGKTSAISGNQFVDACMITLAGNQGDNNQFTRYRWIIQSDAEL